MEAATSDNYRDSYARILGWGWLSEYLNYWTKPENLDAQRVLQKVGFESFEGWTMDCLIGTQKALTSFKNYH